MRWFWTRTRATAPGLDDDPDRGSAIVEFVALGLLLLVPVIYFVVALARVQAGSFAVVAASEQAAQAISVLDGKNLDSDQVREVAAVAVADQGFGAEDLSLTVSCSDGSCSRSGAVATVGAHLSVELPGIPGFAHARVATLHSRVTVISGRYS